MKRLFSLMPALGVASLCWACAGETSLNPATNLNDMFVAAPEQTAQDGGSAPTGSSSSTDSWVELIGPCALETADATERAPPFIEALKAVEFEGIPAQFSLAGLSALERSVVAYALEQPVAELGTSLSTSELLAQKPMGVVVLAALMRDETIDFRFLRDGLNRFYNCSRGYPSTLFEFTVLFGGFGQDGSRLIQSAAKCGERRLFDNNTDQVYMAETLAGPVVRETEIIMANHRQDNQLDFIVYDANGRRSGRSMFPTAGGDEISAQSPFICLSCHVNSETDPALWTYDILFPDAGLCR